MSAKKNIGLAAAGGILFWAMPWRRALTTIVVARRVWQDPKVQKIRRHVEKRVLKSQAAKR